MQFVLNPNPLAIEQSCKTREGQQYYEWRYQKKLSQQKQQLSQLQAFSRDIQKEEDIEHKSSLHKRRIHHSGTFYDYNLEWKNKLNTRLEQVKNLKNKSEAESELELEKMRKQEKEQKKQTLDGYRGPIQGWKERFEHYLQRKICNQTDGLQELTFEPKINDRSRKMTQGMMGRVEDRLIVYGEFLKMKNQEQMNKANSEIINFGAANKKYQTAHSNQSDIFYRLYRDGQQTNRKKKESSLDDNHTFQPKINKLSSQMEDKISKSRKPLYFIRKEIDSIKQIHQSRKQNKGNFEAFLKRNEALLELKRKLGVTLIEQLEQKQNLEKSECTFTPNLNSRSKKIRKQMEQNNKKLEQKIQNEIKTSMSYPTNPYGLQNIDISKLTIPECKQASQYDDSDSLSIYRVENGQKQSQRFSKKQQQYETYLSSSKVKSQKQQQPLKGCSSAALLEGKVFEDSIEKMKNSEWETELSEIESHLQNMMSRASK